MKKYIQEYINELEELLKAKHKFTNEEIGILKDKINYFNQERLIHLIVTLFFVIFTISFLALGMVSYLFLIIFLIGIVFLIFYIKHYFFLENAVQYLYKLYDKIVINKN